MILLLESEINFVIKMLCLTLLLQRIAPYAVGGLSKNGHPETKSNIKESQSVQKLENSVKANIKSFSPLLLNPEPKEAKVHIPSICKLFSFVGAFCLSDCCLISFHIYAFPEHFVHKMACLWMAIISCLLFCSC